MKYNFSDIPEGAEIALMLHSGTVQMRMDANIISFVREDIAFIELQTSTDKILKFDKIDIEVLNADDMPLVWEFDRTTYHTVAGRKLLIAPSTHNSDEGISYS